MKVLISLTDQSFTATKSVGIFNVSVGLARGLAACEGIEELHILANQEVAPLFAGMPSHVILHMVDKKVPRRFSRLWWDQIGLPRAICRIRPDWAILPKGVPPFFPRIGGAKLACYVHDVNWEYYARLDGATANLLPRYQHVYFKSSLLHALRISDLVLTSTNFNRSRYLSYVPAAKTQVVGIGFDGPVMPMGAGAGRDVLFYASPYPHKLTSLGVRYMAAWLAQRADAEDIRVHVLGGLPDGVVLPDERWISYGRLPEAEMMQLMSGQCRAATYFSAYEGFGMPPVECLRAGVPCVASSLPPIRENVPAELLFDNEDEASFIAVMNRAYDAKAADLKCPAYPTWADVAQRALHAMQSVKS